MDWLYSLCFSLHLPGIQSLVLPVLIVKIIECGEIGQRTKGLTLEDRLGLTVAALNVYINAHCVFYCNTARIQMNSV